MRAAPASQLHPCCRPQVLLVSLGVLVVIILAEARIPSAKALANVHAASPSLPFVNQLPGSGV